MGKDAYQNISSSPSNPVIYINLDRPDLKEPRVLNRDKAGLGDRPGLCLKIILTEACFTSPFCLLAYLLLAIFSREFKLTLIFLRLILISYLFCTLSDPACILPLN